MKPRNEKYLKLYYENVFRSKLKFPKPFERLTNSEKELLFDIGHYRMFELKRKFSELIIAFWKKRKVGITSFLLSLLFILFNN